MRIAIFTDTFLPNIDGIVTSTMNLAKGLADRGHKIYIIAPKQKIKKEFRYKNVKVKRVLSMPAIFYPGFKFTNPASIELVHYIIENKIDIIHFQTPFTLGLNAIMLSKLLKVPLVGTFHTLITHPDYRKHAKLDYKFLNKFSWSYIRFYYNKCNLITSPSKEIKNVLIKNGIRKRILTISNGILTANSMRNKKNMKNNILFVGRISYEKNIFYLLDCFKLISDEMPSVKLMVVGDGPQMKKFTGKIKQLGLQKKVKILGSIPHNKLMRSQIYKNAKIFATASLTETQGLTLLEAQTRGLIGVGMNEGGTKDLIKNNYNGFLVKKDDKNSFVRAIIKILSNKSLFKKMQKNTLEEIKKHDLNKVIDTWEKEYKHILGEKNDKDILHNTFV